MSTWKVSFAMSYVSTLVETADADKMLSSARVDTIKIKGFCPGVLLLSWTLLGFLCAFLIHPTSSMNGDMTFLIPIIPNKMAPLFHSIMFEVLQELPPRTR